MLSIPSPSAPRDGADGADPERLSAYPNLQRVAPALARLSEEDLFRLGIDLVLDGIQRRISP